MSRDENDNPSWPLPAPATAKMGLASRKPDHISININSLHNQQSRPQSPDQRQQQQQRYSQIYETLPHPWPTPPSPSLHGTITGGGGTYSSDDLTALKGAGGPLSHARTATGTSTIMTTTTTIKPISSPSPPSSMPPAPTSPLKPFRHLLLTVYRRLFTFIYLVNLVLGILVFLLLPLSSAKKSTVLLTATTANLLVSLIVRNEHMVNLLFRIFVDTRFARRRSLRVRRILAKVYSYGGVHSGCGVAGACWYLAYLGWEVFGGVTATGEPETEKLIRWQWAEFGMACLTSGFLCAILGFAHPSVRERWHNSFECVHRFLGWAVVGLFWAQNVLVAAVAVEEKEVAKGKGTGGEEKTTTTIGMELAKSPAFWMLVAITALVIYPWTRLRKRQIVGAEHLSDHALRLRFAYASASDVKWAQTIKITDAPLWETHAFAVIPEYQNDTTTTNATSTRVGGGGSFSGYSSSSDEEFELKDKKHYNTTTTTYETAAQGNGNQVSVMAAGSTSTSQQSNSNGRKIRKTHNFSILISHAGDWTRKIVRGKTPGSIWVRGLPATGVLRCAGLFRPVTIIATGSGIGPCLSFFHAIAASRERTRRRLSRSPVDIEKGYSQDYDEDDENEMDRVSDAEVRVVWSARNPETIYGDGVLDVIRKADPRAVIWNTKERGRPNLVDIAWGVMKEGVVHGDGTNTPSEASIVISNMAVTREVVYGLESRGMPSFGPIFDS